MKRACLSVVLVAITACHGQPRAPITTQREVRSPEQRVRASLARWGAALERGDRQALAKAEDGAGQVAFPYVAIKAAAGHAPGGARAVEQTTFMLVASVLFQTLWPETFGAPKQTWHAYVPAGPIGPGLVDAGLAKASPESPAFVIVPVPWRSTLGRIEEAAAKHRAKLVEQRAWTCRLAAIEKTISRDEPTLARAATVSQNIFGGWHEGLEQLWLVRADCASGPALFVVTGRRDGNDQILLARLF